MCDYVVKWFHKMGTYTSTNCIFCNTDYMSLPTGTLLAEDNMSNKLRGAESFLRN